MKFSFFKRRNKKRLIVRVAGATDVGLKRAQNQDSFFATTSPESSGKVEALLIVADGMGGLESGEVASEMAVEFIREKYTEQILGQGISRETLQSKLTNFVKDANTCIYFQGSEGLDVKRGIMGTTCTVGLVAENRLFIAHAGDSRAYLLRDKKLSQLTRDDSWVMDQVASGNLTQSQARHHPNRNVVTQALGINQELDIEEINVELQTGDRLLLCSDGLHGLVDDEDIANILQEPSQESVINALIDSAKAEGGHDNITAVLGDFSN